MCFGKRDDSPRDHLIRMKESNTKLHSFRKEIQMTAGHWTFGQKVSAAFAFSVALTIAICVIAVIALHNVVESKDEVITVYGENMIDAEKLAVAGAWKANAIRGFLLDKQDRHLGEVR